MHEPQPQSSAEISLQFSFILQHFTCTLAPCRGGLSAASSLSAGSCGDPFKTNVQMLYSGMGTERNEEKWEEIWGVASCCEGHDWKAL